MALVSEARPASCGPQACQLLQLDGTHQLLVPGEFRTLTRVGLLKKMLFLTRFSDTSVMMEAVYEESKDLQIVFLSISFTETVMAKEQTKN